MILDCFAVMVSIYATRDLLISGNKVCGLSAAAVAVLMLFRIVRRADVKC